MDRLQFVESAHIVQDTKSAVVEIEIINVVGFPIAGLVVQPNNKYIEDHGLGARVLIEFELVRPGGTTIYREEIERLPEGFPQELSIDLFAWDILDGDGNQVVRDIFWTHWPTIRSEAELRRVRLELCG